MGVGLDLFKVAIETIDKSSLILLIVSACILPLIIIVTLCFICCITSKTIMPINILRSRMQDLKKSNF